MKALRPAPGAAKRPMTVTEMAALGGKACAKSRSPQERQRVARKAVETRWKRHRAAVRQAAKALRTLVQPDPAPAEAKP